jgi:hypothetical protein
MVHGLVDIWVVGGRGGYVSLAHFVLWFTEVSKGVGGAIWLKTSGIRSMLAESFICWVYVRDPMGMSL